MNVKNIFFIVGMVLSMAYTLEACIQILVCGTDEITYPTPCALKEAAKTIPNLTIAYNRPCDPEEPSREWKTLLSKPLLTDLCTFLSVTPVLT